MRNKPQITVTKRQPVNELADLKPEVTILSDEAYDRLAEILEEPPKANPALVELMRKRKPWAE